MHALIFNNLESVEFLLEHGADVNSIDYEYQTPLMCMRYKIIMLKL